MINKVGMVYCLYSTKIEFLLLKIVLFLGDSADPDEMQHYAAIHPAGLHCLP